MFVAAALARMFPEAGGRRSCRADRQLQPEFPPSTLRPLLPAVAVLAAALLYGHVRIASNSTKPGPRIALIQGSIDVQFESDPDPKVPYRIIAHRNERTFEGLLPRIARRLTEDNRQDRPACWPESMFPFPPITFEAPAPDGHKALKWLPKTGRSWLARTARSLGVPLLLGVDTSPFRRRRRTASIRPPRRPRRPAAGPLRQDASGAVWRVRAFCRYFPWFQRLTPLPISATPGDKPAASSLAGVRIAPNICYETVLPQVIRGQVNALTAAGREPDILVNLTNDGWFWGSSELDMHLACGVFRAVECRKPLLIAANTGFSAWIDSDGRVLSQGRRHANDVIVAQPLLDVSCRSWYLDHGDWFAGACLAACALLAGFGLWGRSAELRRRGAGI